MALLTPETAPAYVMEHREAVKVFGPEASLRAEEIHGGNLNYAFQVHPRSVSTEVVPYDFSLHQVTDGENSVFVKQAPDFIKCFGSEAKLHRERMELEVRVYREWAEVLGEADTARFLPELYHFDIESMTVIMEFLGAYELLEKDLIAKGTMNESVAKAIANFMARTHAAAHSMPPGGKPGGKPTEPSEGNCTSSHMPPHEHWFMTLVLLM